MDEIPFEKVIDTARIFNEDGSINENNDDDTNKEILRVIHEVKIRTSFRKGSSSTDRDLFLLAHENGIKAELDFVIARQKLKFH